MAAQRRTSAPIRSTIQVLLAGLATLAPPAQSCSNMDAPMRAVITERSAPRQSVTRITFRQLYFPPTRKHVATRALSMLETDPESSTAANLADHDVLPALFDKVTIPYISELFGDAFADAVQKAPSLRWSGPIRSDLGWHLVWIDPATVEETRAGRVGQARK